jgi:hypothetical protein
MRRSSFTARPTLETLGARVVPTVMVSRLDDDGVLKITGDSEDNVVRVAVVGDNVVVVADGRTRVLRGAADDLTAIEADLRGGDDVLRVNLGSSLGRGDSLDITAETGNGDDTVVVRADGLGRDAELSADIDTGDGNDRVVFDLGNLGRGASVDATVDLGEDDDVFRWIGGSLGRDASVSLDVDAGAGDDRVVLDLGDLGNGASFVATVDLGDGDDVLRLLSGEISRFATASITGDLGDGEDTVNDSNLDDDVDVTLEGEDDE